MTEKSHDTDLQLQLWNYIFGFVGPAVVKCAIELGLADAIDANGQPMTLAELSAALGCSPSLLFRVLRFLVGQRLLAEQLVKRDEKVLTAYALTALSCQLLTSNSNSMAALLLLETSPEMLKPWHFLSEQIRSNGPPAFEAAHGEDVWNYTRRHPAHNKIINNAMSSHARMTMRAVVECVGVFDGLATVVDVGGGNGTAMATLVEANPLIKAVNFDLPHVVEKAPKMDGVDHVGGDMFVSVPQAEAAFLMFVLHNWGDEECVKILRKCKESIQKDKGKVIIVEIVIKEKEDEESPLSSVGLMLDMVMMAHTSTGKERTEAEWQKILVDAGFSRYTITRTPVVHSIIEAYP